MSLLFNKPDQRIAPGTFSPAVDSVGCAVRWYVFCQFQWIFFCLSQLGYRWFTLNSDSLKQNTRWMHPFWETLGHRTGHHSKTPQPRIECRLSLEVGLKKGWILSLYWIYLWELCIYLFWSQSDFVPTVSAPETDKGHRTDIGTSMWIPLSGTHPSNDLQIVIKVHTSHRSTLVCFPHQTQGPFSLCSANLRLLRLFR